MVSDGVTERVTEGGVRVGGGGDCGKEPGGDGDGQVEEVVVERSLVEEGAMEAVGKSVSSSLVEVGRLAVVGKLEESLEG